MNFTRPSALASDGFCLMRKGKFPWLNWVKSTSPGSISVPERVKIRMLELASVFGFFFSLGR